jgi:hypothetical protein
MLQRIAVIALTLTAVSAFPAAAQAPPSQGQSLWQRTDNQHFEIHYLPALAPELDRVGRSAERAYDRISKRLGFVLPTKVPLVMFAPPGPLTREQVVAYATSDQVAPPQPHRSRFVLPLPEFDAQLDALMVHELTHLLVFGLLSQRAQTPDTGGDGGIPRWVTEGIANHMVGAWPEEHERLMRDLVRSADFPAVSGLTSSGGFADLRLNDALGHAAFDYIESRWGPTGVRRFLNALIVPRVNKTYDAVLDLTPVEFDAAFRQYAERRFRPVDR